MLLAGINTWYKNLHTWCLLSVSFNKPVFLISNLPVLFFPHPWPDGHAIGHFQESLHIRSSDHFSFHTIPWQAVLINWLVNFEDEHAPCCFSLESTFLKKTHTSWVVPLCCEFYRDRLSIAQCCLWVCGSICPILLLNCLLQTSLYQQLRWYFDLQLPDSCIFLWISS